MGKALALSRYARVHARHVSTNIGTAFLYYTTINAACTVVPLIPFNLTLPIFRVYRGLWDSLFGARRQQDNICTTCCNRSWPPTLYTITCDTRSCYVTTMPYIFPSEILWLYRIVSSSLRFSVIKAIPKTCRLIHRSYRPRDTCLVDSTPLTMLVESTRRHLWYELSLLAIYCQC